MRRGLHLGSGNPSPGAPPRATGAQHPQAAGFSGHPVAARAVPGQSQADPQGTDVAKITKTFQYGKHTVTLETGEIARQASGAVIVKMDDTVLLVSAVAAQSAREGQDFFRSEERRVGKECRARW